MVTYSEKITTPKFRVGYENLLKGEKTDDGGQKFPMTMVFAPGTDLSDMKALASIAAKDEWGGSVKGVKMPFLKHTATNQSGARYCDAMPDIYEDDDDAVFVRGVSYQKVGLVDQKLADIFSSEDFYSGCYAHATVVAKTWENNSKRGVTFYLNNVQKLEDGVRLAKSKSPAKMDFQPIEGATDSEDIFD